MLPKSTRIELYVERSDDLGTLLADRIVTLHRSAADVNRSRSERDADRAMMQTLIGLRILVANRKRTVLTMPGGPCDRSMVELFNLETVVELLADQTQWPRPFSIGAPDFTCAIPCR